MVEDEQKMAKALQEGLEADDYSVGWPTPAKRVYLVQAQTFDLVILDVMLPGHDGFEILSTLRQRGIRTPVLLLTSRDTIEDRVRGLDTGADDYLVKPFAFPELLARTRALLRRGSRMRATTTSWRPGNGCTAAARGAAAREIELTAREFELLEYFFRQQGRVVSREMLARDIWKETARQTPLDNVIDAQIVRLRRKLDGRSRRNFCTPCAASVSSCGRRRVMRLRTRLTLWYVSVLAALLILAWGGTCALLFWQLRGQLDHFAIQEIETVEGLSFTPVGKLRCTRITTTIRNRKTSSTICSRCGPDGAVLYRNERLGTRRLGGDPFPSEGDAGYFERSFTLADGTRVRLVSRLHSLDGRPLLIRLAHSEEPYWLRIKELFAASLVVLPLILAIAGVAGYALARRALTPLEQMAKRAQKITPENLHARLPVTADDELGAIVQSVQRDARPAGTGVRAAPPVHIGCLPRATDALA